MEDGSELKIVPGQSYTIPPGHDAWVEGDEPFVAIEVMSAEQFGKPRDSAPQLAGAVVTWLRACRMRHARSRLVATKGVGRSRSLAACFLPFK